MKTTDLISLILYELGEGDKYGFELTKSIENLSNGEIIIKQATLYTILKKLEKSKFISSYWQDSEIGGKRHYYKLTENGNMQLSTMPKIESILKNAIQDEKIENEHPVNAATQSASKPMPAQNVQDVQKINAANADHPQVKETVLPTDEVFKDDSIDSLTETEINSANANLLHEKRDISSEEFANNKSVSKFAESQPSYSPAELQNKMQKLPTMAEQTQNIQPQRVNNEEIKYVEYVNFKKSPEYIKAKKLAKNTWLKVISTCAYLLAMLVICAVVCQHYSNSIMGNIFLVAGLLIVLFYPTLYAYKLQKFKITYQEAKVKLSAKTHIILAVGLMLFLIMSIFIANIAMGNASFKKLFMLANFSNIYAPLLVSSFVLADLLFSYIFIYRKNKR